MSEANEFAVRRERDRAAKVALVGGAFVFSVLNIARPIVAPRGAVTARGAKKTIEIPCVSRGDGVGDNARAAKTFKGSLIRIEQMESSRE
ncbi:hypothetical protein IVA78_25440 [Bradyrhizobium sp. 137]|uniref:hypothetical protein n=1 Tax=Bradyrhizobium sp. 137 TaxID=2782614 RepID=UPI001FF70EF1|nr:hypothetical protein [Bradyrhizobium sp. 137]MCK1758424.1 hypothetical protein [Bradyrhizobium sp. 137]